jgi:hypothetical protein
MPIRMASEAEAQVSKRAQQAKRAKGRSGANNTCRGLLCLIVLLLLGTRAAHADEGYLRYLPSDAKLVLTVHVTVLADEDKKNGLEQLRRLYVSRLAPELGKEAKLPISDVSRVVIAWPFAGTLASVVLIRCKVDRPLLEKQIQTAAKKSRKRMAVGKMGKPPVLVCQRLLDDRVWTDLFPQLAAIPPALRRLVASPDVYAAALDDETVFVSLAGRAPMERALRARPPRTSLRIPDELAKLLRKQDEKDLAAFAMLDDSLHPGLQLVAPEAVKETFDQFEHVTARIRGGKEILVTLQVTGKPNQGGELATKSEQLIKALRSGLPKLVPSKAQRVVIEGLFKAIRISRKDNVVTLTGKLPVDDARKLLPVVP